MGRAEPQNPVTDPAWGSNKGVFGLPSLILSKIPPILPTLPSIFSTLLGSVCPTSSSHAPQQIGSWAILP